MMDKSDFEMSFLHCMWPVLIPGEIIQLCFSIYTSCATNILVRISPEISACLLNLAVADLINCLVIAHIFSISSPKEEDPKGKENPTTSIPVALLGVVGFISTYTLAVVAYKIYRHVCYPADIRVESGRVKIFLSLIWIFGTALFGIQACLSHVETYKDDFVPKLEWCRKAYAVFIFVTSIIIPLFCTIAMRVAILRSSYEENASEGVDDNIVQMHCEAKRMAENLFIIIIAAILTCWLPQPFFNLFSVLDSGFCPGGNDYGLYNTYYLICECSRSFISCIATTLTYFKIKKSRKEREKERNCSQFSGEERNEIRERQFEEGQERNDVTFKRTVNNY